MKNRHLVQLGIQIRQKRKAMGLSQEQLAFQADIDRSYCGSIERGERNVTILTIIRLAECLNCSIADLTQNIPKSDYK